MIGKKIVIVGSGTAAWISAFMFKSLGGCDNITIIEPINNQPIGVGESTTPHFWYFLNSWCPYFDEKDFIKKTGSTLKFGVVHKNWNGDGKYFLNPIDSLGKTNTNAFPLDLDIARTYCVSENIHPSIGYEALMIKNNLAPFEIINNTLIQKGNYAYHLNIDNTLTYFKVIGKKQGIKLIYNSVKNINKTDKIESLILDDGKEITADFFIDCTGQNRILSSLFDNQFIEYPELPLNSALVYKQKHKNKIPNYTSAIATKDGWQWEIPVKNELHVGYLYNKELVNEEQLLEQIPDSKLIRFKSGRINKFLNKNVLSVGLSSGFVEPLEATSLHSTLIQLNVFLSDYFRPDIKYPNSFLENRYNEYFQKYWNSIRDWIRMHYITSRNNSIFWNEVQNLPISNNLQNLLDLYKIRMPRESDTKSNEIYQTALTFHILSGMNILNSSIAKNELIHYDLYNLAKEKYTNIVDNNNNYIKNFISHDNFILH